ncbi:MAG: SWIM zinc finger family protein [Lewinellaceae bacterium]|nr:SWIM zinc finger family protein [Lewinellaceae bacterium]
MPLANQCDCPKKQYGCPHLLAAFYPKRRNDSGLKVGRQISFDKKENLNGKKSPPNRNQNIAYFLAYLLIW